MREEEAQSVHQLHQTYYCAEEIIVNAVFRAFGMILQLCGVVQNEYLDRKPVYST